MSIISTTPDMSISIIEDLHKVCFIIVSPNFPPIFKIVVRMH